MKMLREMTLTAAMAALMPAMAPAGMLELPAHAVRAAEQSEPLASYRLPIGPWDGAEIQTIWAEGEVLRQAWTYRSPGATTLQLLTPLRDQLTEAGFEILFECETDACGGFDFRYATDVLPEPEMHVDLGDYRFLSAQRMGDEAPEYISLMISRSSARGFVQITRVGTPGAEGATLFAASTKNPPVTELPAEPEAIAAELENQGRAVLADLSFETGSSTLIDDEFVSLSALAEYLLDNPDRKITLVGHTDAEGALEKNIALSEKRAEAVREHLILALAVPAEQIEARGVGFLAPLASNLTDDGRTQNRRVEVILTSTQ
ncbi:OmpA family protein [Actibacterium sp. XHP0104]|uniref:OmpA family protein n=1 Tax=Actibacterium sp. XHP0104 TaxID=2984335 RepID=UPI0021E72A3A|nr:OmpA family protein [Actibacterium sp. XHP0104]MCV2881663.1 OmpA family protein [Actibacterium sp. XHP0104]